MKNIAILTFEGFNELDSFNAFTILNRMKEYGWNTRITCPSKNVTSMNGVSIKAQELLEYANTADAVIIGSGIYTRDVAQNAEILERLNLNPNKQIIGAQCSGTLLLAKLGLLDGLPACTDLTTKPWVVEAGVNVLNRPFVANENIATAGGCLSSQYLAAWIIAKLKDVSAAKDAIHYVAPVGEKEQTVEHSIKIIESYI